MLLVAFLLGAPGMPLVAPISLAQDTIRIESNQVLVPVDVASKKALHTIEQHFASPHLIGRSGAAAIASMLAVNDLTKADFRVFDDDKEQPVQMVTVEPSLFWNLRDNRGHHTEYVGPGGGKWSTVEWPANVVGDPDMPQHYLVSYIPPDSAKGSCHHVKIHVNRSDVFVRFRTEYCNTEHIPSDPLNGTALGDQLENELPSSENKNKAGVSVLAMPLFSKSDMDTVRVHIAVDWQAQYWKSGSGSKAKGVLGMVLGSGGRLASRLSDLAERQGVTYSRPLSEFAEERYETQLNLPPGDYDFKIILGDGQKFVQGETHLTVAPLPGKELAIGTVALCKRIDDVAGSRSAALPGAWTAPASKTYVPLRSDGVEFQPTAETRFEQGETLYTYFQIYDLSLQEGPTSSVEIQIRVVDLKTGEVKSDSQSISAMRYAKPGSPIISVGRGIDISRLPKGSYSLSVQASDSAGERTPWRSANFTVH